MLSLSLSLKSMLWVRMDECEKKHGQCESTAISITINVALSQLSMFMSFAFESLSKESNSIVYMSFLIASPSSY